MKNGEKMAENKYGKHVLRNAFKTHHQLEGLSANGDELNADCILTHHVVYKPEIMLTRSYHKKDFIVNFTSIMQSISCYGSCHRPVPV